ncbi:MAG: hypothetical protein QOE05_82 [Actinomycetota bacterium]|jgi:hypothetical protein|nr:hypothetical protein [Actinomycetota bacterium]
MSARVVARCCAASGALGLALLGGPAWAVDLPAVPGAPAPAPSLPIPVPTPLPTSVLPSPVASALAPVLSQLPGNEPSARPSPSPAPKAKPAPRSDRQAARAQTGIAPMSATLALRAGSRTAELRAFPGFVAPMAVQPQPVVPQLTPVATVAVPGSLPLAPSQEGLPAVVVALAIVTASAAAAGQVAEMAERRRQT